MAMSAGSGRTGLSCPKRTLLASRTEAHARSGARPPQRRSRIGTRDAAGAIANRTTVTGLPGLSHGYLGCDH